MTTAKGGASVMTMNLEAEARRLCPVQNHAAFMPSPGRHDSDACHEDILDALQKAQADGRSRGPAVSHNPKSRIAVRPVGRRPSSSARVDGSHVP